MGENAGEDLLLEKEEYYEEMPGSPETEKKKPLEFISSGNLEIDRKLEGGIPAGSLCLLEGAKDSGKSVLMQQIMWGALNQDKKVLVLTTEKTSRNLLNTMEKLKQDISDYFIIGRSKIFEINSGYVEENPELSENLLQILLECLNQCEEELVLIDSLTILAVSASENALLNFFTGCVKLCDKGKTILISVHGYAFPQEVLHRLRSICDSCFELRIEQVGDKLIKTMEIQKLRGARKITGNMLSFNVDSDSGLKIIPVSKVKA
ncbi:MAG: ATPase domain-containing protein [Methanosarcina sp.]|nr:ATPase domain-containing protein [Methanosarcina sp.]MDD3873524.1 ATPase domain-containing protein [Methanosarcina sp.]MDD4522127.1 ATPase domain-containing protein [Methanosarcina sp.]HHV23873.1 AAA family ATPase [Methanosarcina sp.]